MSTLGNGASVKYSEQPHIKAQSAESKQAQRGRPNVFAHPGSHPPKINHKKGLRKQRYTDKSGESENAA